MNIIMDEEKSSVNVRDMVFLDLTIGDVFLGEDKELYMRTEPLSTDFEDYNSARLKTGELVYFDEGDKVWKYEDPIIFNSNSFNNKVVI